jgi:hypothetical protein
MLEENIDVIRVEHPDGYGMFRSYDKDHNIRSHSVDEICHDLCIRHYDFNEPSGDGLNLDRDSKDWFCAYKTIEQIQEWVKPEEFKILFDNDYKIYVLSVSEYQIGESQIIYTKDSILNKRDISTLFTTNKI